MIINVPNQNAYFEGTKALDGNTYRFTFRWNTTSEKWYMDVVGISNSVDIKGIAVVCGRDLLRQHGYSELGKIFVIDGQGMDEDPSFESLGARHIIEYYSLDQIADAE